MTSLKEWVEHLPYADLESSHDDAMDPHIENYIKELEEYMDLVKPTPSDPPTPFASGYEFAVRGMLGFLREEKNERK